MPKGRKPSGRDKDFRVFPFSLTCQLCGAQEHSYGNFRQHMSERGCSGYPVHCGHCGTLFFAGLEISQHLNVRGLSRSISISLYNTVTQSTSISVNNVFPTAVSLCPSNISLLPSAIPAPSILQFSLNCLRPIHPTLTQAPIIQLPPRAKIQMFSLYPAQLKALRPRLSVRA